MKIAQLRCHFNSFRFPEVFKRTEKAVHVNGLLESFWI